jgi:hypothetical protein
MPRPWKDLMVLGPTGERANRIFLEAKQVMKAGGVSTTTGEPIPGLDKSVIADRWLKYLIFAMAMDQTEIAGTAAIQDQAEAMLTGVGVDWENTDKLFRKTIVHLVNKDRDYVQSEKFWEDVMDPEKILLFVKKHRVTEETYSKDKARGREKQVGLCGIEIDRIVSTAKPLLTEIHRRQSYEKKKKNFVTFDRSSASPKEVELHARFPDYNPCILVALLDTPDKLKAFAEWHEKIHLKSNI